MLRLCAARPASLWRLFDPGRASRPAFSSTARSGHAVRLRAHSESFLPGCCACRSATGGQSRSRNSWITAIGACDRHQCYGEKARKLGLEIGMTKTEAESCPDLVIREQSLALEASAHAALVDCVARFSPRCEDVSVDTVILDLSGLGKLMGTPLQIAQNIREQASALSLYVNVGVASNIDSAMHAARVAKGIRVLPAGKEGDELQDVSITVLDPSSDVLGVFERWGIRTLGQLAALPEIALTERLGQEGLRLQRLAQGKSMRMLSPTEPPLEFRESMELDSPVADIESLSFIFARLLDQLCARLLWRSLAAGVVRIALTLEVATLDATASSKVFTRVVKLPVPTTDTKLLLKLLQLDLDAHPPGAPGLEGLGRSRTLAAAAGAGGHVCSPRPGTTTSGGDAGTTAQVGW